MNQTDGFAERLRAAMIGKDATEIAREIGVSRASFYKWLAGKFEPNLEKLVALGTIANVSLDWLIAGRGTMRPNELPGYVKPSFPTDPTPLAFESRWLDTNFGPMKNSLLLFEVQDDSMETTLRKGDLLLAYRVDQYVWSDPKNGIYLIGRTRAEEGEKVLVNWVGDDTRPIGLRDAKPGEDIRGHFIFDAKGNPVNRLVARRIEWTAKPSAITLSATILRIRSPSKSYEAIRRIMKS